MDGGSGKISTWRACGRLCKAAGPWAGFGGALILLLGLAILPEAVRQWAGILKLSPGMRTFVVVSTLLALVATGWLISFSGRGYWTRTQYVRYLVQSIFLAPVLFGAVVFCLFAYVDQMREVYLAMLDDRKYVHFGASVLAVLMLSFVLGLWQRSVGQGMLEQLYNDHRDLTFDAGLSRVLSFKGSLSAVLPLAGLFAGAFGLLADAWQQGTRMDSLDRLLGGQSVDVKDAAVALDKLKLLLWPIFIGALISTGILWWWMARQMAHPVRWLDRSVVWVTGVVTGLLLGMPAFFPDLMVAVSQWLGPLAVTALTLTAFAGFFATLSYYSVKTRWPWTAIFLLVLVIYLAVPVLIDRTPAPTATQRDARKLATGDAEAKFLAWLEKRPDRARFNAQGKRYPVFLVAASGGGIYAASAAATFLAEVQDDCASFAQHVFAISGVSGGAVGSTLFNALSGAWTGDKTNCKRNESWGHTEFIEHVIRADHLSPVVSALASDIFRKIVPLFGDVGDRPDMLQRSFRKAFREVAACSGIPTQDPQFKCNPLTDSDRLGMPVGLHWSPEAAAPGLILNTTWSETGYRAVFAPFAMRSLGDGTLFNFTEIDVAVEAKSAIQAALVSARFPGIVPAWAVDVGAKRWNFVDGGYVDNSGVSTALDLYQGLDRLMNRPKSDPLRQQIDRLVPGGIDLRLILITDAEPARGFDEITGSSYSDTMAPLSALLNVRKQLANRAIAQAIERLAPGKSRSALSALGSTADANDSRIYIVNLEQNSFPLPLGWKISGITNNVIGYMLGRPALCDPQFIKADKDEEVTRAARAVIENSCVKRRMLDLMGWVEPVAAQTPGGVLRPR